LKNLICLAPELLLRLLKHCRQEEVPPKFKKAVGFMLTYFYHPKDFLPEEHQGLFGYLDDAYCIALVYEKVLRVLMKMGIELNSNDKDFLKQFSLTKRRVRAVIPEEARKVSEMVEDVLTGDRQSFFSIFE